MQVTEQPTDQLASILPSLTTVVDRIQPHQLDAPTPCDRFTVLDVLNHMIVLGGSFGYWFRGHDAPTIEPAPADGQVPREQFGATMRDLLEAVRSPGAMERTISAPVGEMPGEQFARLVAFDGVVHGWDLATSTGQAFAVDPDILAAVDEFARAAIAPEMRDGDTFKEAVEPPAGASALERLVAFSGRTL